jgi:hypothetical protein
LQPITRRALKIDERRRATRKPRELPTVDLVVIISAIFGQNRPKSLVDKENGSNRPFLIILAVS